MRMMDARIEGWNGIGEVRLPSIDGGMCYEYSMLNLKHPC